MENEDITLESLSGESQLNSADDNKAVEGVAQTTADTADSMTLAELNQYLGKDFKDKATALKSVKDTFSYVGKKKEDIAKEVATTQPDTSKLANELAEMRKERFFDKNSQYEPYKGIIEKLGSDPSQVVNTPEFKAIFDKAKGYDESQNLKTVLESNPRLASSRDSLSKARDMQSKGGRQSDVENLVANAVLDAFSK